MPALRDRTLHTPSRRAIDAAVCVLCALIAAGCGDATGSPIRFASTPDAALSAPAKTHTSDAGMSASDAATDATSSASLLPLPTSGSMGMHSPNEGPGSIHDDHPGDDVPQTPHCANAAGNWPQQSRQDEQEMERQIAELRAGGVLCSDRFNRRLPQLDFPSELRCSARLHSLDMATATPPYFSTRSPDGTQPGQRMSQAGFKHGAVAESIVTARGPDLGQVLIDLQSDPDGCSNLTNPEFTDLGIGNYAGLWTFDFAAAQ